MSLIRLIVIALIIYLLIQIFKRWAANKNSASSEQQQNSATNSTSMVQCKTCQLHIPENEALQKDGEYYCSQAHLDGKQD